MRVGTVNMASGRRPGGRVLDAAGLEKAVAGLDVDVLAVQEVDAGQPRSQRVDQAAALAAGLGAADWRAAATVAGTPDPFRSWSPAGPVLRGPGTPADGPHPAAMIPRRKGWAARNPGGLEVGARDSCCVRKTHS